MSHVLILGANGGIARHATDLFLKKTNARLTLYLRNSGRLKNVDSSRVRVVEGDVLDSKKLKEAMDEIDYEVTQKGQPFKGSTVSRKSVAALVVKLAESPELEVRRSLGVNKPQ